MVDRPRLGAAGRGESCKKERGNLCENARKLLYAAHSISLWNVERPERLREIRPIQHILGVYKDINEAILNPIPTTYQAFPLVPRPTRLRDNSESRISIRRPVLVRKRGKSLPRAATKLDQLRPAAIRCMPSTTHRHRSPSPSKDPEVDKFLMRLQSEQILRNGKETERVRALLKSVSRTPARVRSNPRSLLRVATLRDLSPPAVNPAEAWTQT